MVQSPVQSLDQAPPRLPRGYVPVLQDHKGERDALSGLRADAPEVFQSVTPLLQIVGRKTEPLSRNAIKDHVKRLVAAAGTEQPVYLDFLRSNPAHLLETPKGPQLTADIAYEVAARHRLKYLPVIYTDSDIEHIRSAAAAAVLEGRGLALRHRALRRALTPGTDPLKETLELLEDPALIDIGTVPEEIDLLIDLEYLAPDMEIRPERFNRLISKCAAVAPWRRMVLLGSSIPATLSCIPEGTNGEIERREWKLWSSLPDEIRAKVDFGDYGVQHPLPPATSGPGMRANIRYALEDRHFIVRGRGDFRIEGSAQYVGLCERIMHSGFFRGPGYSWGDRVIKLCADGLLNPGSQSKWRGAGMAHHIRVTNEQILALG